MVGQLFVQLYPSSACAPMHAQFAAAYSEASEDLANGPREAPAFDRREVGYPSGRAMMAVA